MSYQWLYNIITVYSLHIVTVFDKFLIQPTLW